MWEAVAGIIAVISAAAAYYFKRAADHPPEKIVQLENDLTRSAKSVKLLESRVRRLRVVNRKLQEDLKRERNKNLDRMSASDAAGRLRGDA